MVEAWSIERWNEILEVGGTASALLFTGVALCIDARVRRAQTLIEITKQHRELWLEFHARPELGSVLDMGRDMAASPLSAAEVRFLNLIFLHIRATYYASKAKTYVQPERLREDIREFFSYPATRAAWDAMAHLQDRGFLDFIEKTRRKQ